MSNDPLITRELGGDPAYNPPRPEGYSEADIGRIHELDMALAAFTAEMRKKLIKNLHKREDWKTIPMGLVLGRFHLEVEELKLALKYETAGDVRSEAADVANFALFIFHRIGQEGTERENSDALRAETSKL